MTLTAEDWPMRWRGSSPAFANSTPPLRASAAAPTAPAPAATWRPKIWSIFWKAWATKRGSTWKSCWTRPNLRAASPLVLIRGIFCARAGPAPAALLQQYQHKDYRVGQASAFQGLISPPVESKPDRL